MGRDLSPDDHDDAPIEAGASLEVWDRRTVLETFGETDLRVQGPKKVAEDGPTYISIHAGPEDDEYDDAGGHCHITLEPEDAQQLAAALLQASEDDPDILLDEGDTTLIHNHDRGADDK